MDIDSCRHLHLPASVSGVSMGSAGAAAGAGDAAGAASSSLSDSRLMTSTAPAGAATGAGCADGPASCTASELVTGVANRLSTSTNGVATAAMLQEDTGITLICKTNIVQYAELCIALHWGRECIVASAARLPAHGAFFTTGLGSPGLWPLPRPPLAVPPSTLWCCNLLLTAEGHLQPHSL